MFEIKSQSLSCPGSQDWGEPGAPAQLNPNPAEAAKALVPTSGIPDIAAAMGDGALAVRSGMPNVIAATAASARDTDLCERAAPRSKPSGMCHMFYPLRAEAR